jgi:hypothetical protein
VILVIVEIHALHDVIAEADADIGVRLQLARHGDCLAANVEA